MAKLMIDAKAAVETWWHLSDTEELVRQPFTVSLARWHDQRDQLVNHAEQNDVLPGVRLNPGDDPLSLIEDLARLALIVIHIENASDGRVYSMAALLREHANYRGELRVTGDVALDQLLFMSRCGINAYELADEADPERFIARYERFYQSGGPQSVADNLITTARLDRRTYSSESPKSFGPQPSPDSHRSVAPFNQTITEVST